MRCYLIFSWPLIFFLIRKGVFFKAWRRTIQERERRLYLIYWRTPINTLDASFTFSETREGHDYWWDLHQEYKNQWKK